MMTRPFNPYVTGNPVGNSSAFVGRSDVLREVLRILRRPRDNAIVLHGQRRIGKTSILQHLAAQLLNEGPYRPVYFDLQDKAGRPLGSVLENLAQAITRALGWPDPDLGSNPAAAFRKEWLPATLNNLPDGHSLVILFDEFDVPAVAQPDQASAAFFPYLRDLLASDPERLQFIFVIGRKVDDLGAIALSLFKGTPYVHISLLEWEAADDLVHLSHANHSLYWSDDAMERVWELTHGHPFLIQQLCSYAWDQAHDQEALDQPSRPLEQTSLPPYQPSRPSDQPSLPPYQPSRPSDQPSLPQYQPSRPPYQPSLPSDQPSRPSDQTSLPSDQAPRPVPTVTSEQVDAVVPISLERSRNTMEWLWNGLGPAERVVASALAQIGPGSITEDDLENLLRESGVRVAIRELQNAPQMLQDWDILEPAEGGYRFRVELLRRWIAEHKPLHQVQEEMDRIEPVAENLYQVAVGFYQGGQLDKAIDPLHQAIELNPNHVGANQLLAGIHLAQARAGEAVQLLERLYKYQPAAARPRLVDAYLAQVKVAQDENNDENELLAFYGRILELDPQQTEAAAGRRRIWRRWGDAALEVDDLPAAQKAYALAGLHDQVTEVELEMRRREMAGRLEELESLEQEEQYAEALELAGELANEYPELRDWAADTERIQGHIHLAGRYQRALGALQSGDRQTARTCLAEVIALDPGYKQATRYLHQAVTGAEVVEAPELHPGAAPDREPLVASSQNDALKDIPQLGVGELLEAEPKPDDTQQLSLWNPLDHLRLLWWALVSPQQLDAYRQAFARTAPIYTGDETDEQRVAKWSTVVLGWLPFVILVLIIGPGNLLGKFPLLFAGDLIAILVLWLLAGWLGAGNPTRLAAVVVLSGLIGSLMGGRLGAMRFALGAGGIAFGLALEAANGILFGAALAILDKIPAVLSYTAVGVVGMAASIVAIGVADLAASGEIGNATHIWAGVLGGIISLIGAILLAAVVRRHVLNGLERQQVHARPSAAGQTVQAKE